MPSPGRPEPLTLVYLLAGTPLFGGVKVVLRQAGLMAQRGHRVTVVSPGPPPDWFSLDVPYREVPELAAEHLPPADLTVATYWTTLAPALGRPRGEVVHYCQGYEACYTHNEADHPAIREAYAAPVPALVVAPHLAELLARDYGRPARLVPQPLEPFWRPEPRHSPHSRPRVLVVSPFEIDWKGVATALAAVRLLRERGREVELVRLSQWPLPEAERALAAADEVHCHLAPPAVADLVRGADLLLAPSWEQEGFGLPALEAMASGVPVVASDIPSYRWFAGAAAVLVPPRDPVALATAAEEVLWRPEEWRRRRKEGLAAAAAFAEERAAVAAEEALVWAATGAWREARSAAAPPLPGPVR